VAAALKPRGTSFRADTNPIDPFRRKQAAVGFHRDFEVLGMQSRNQSVIDLQQGLPAG
jgi:hypothetical protein